MSMSNIVEEWNNTRMAGEGQPFIAQFVNDARNPESLRGKTLRTSPIQSVHAMRMQEQELEL